MNSRSICLPSAVLSGIQEVVGFSSKEQPVVLHEPYFRGTDAWSYVKDCLDTGWVSSAGQWVSRFEKQLTLITGSHHAIAVTNGTVGLRLALHLVGVTPGDEVLLPPLSFVATANAISHLGAVPHFIDVEPKSLGMCPRALAARLESIAEISEGCVFNKETGRRISAVLPVHIFGHPAEVDQLRTVADFWGLPLVEDAAEALASWRNNIHCGLFGSLGILSFNGNKLITTGGGGALITNDSDLAKKARHLSTTAKQPHPWSFDHDAVGWNDRMPNLNAALGCAQLNDLDKRLQAKRLLAEEYAQAFADLEGIELLNQPDDCCSNYWLLSLRFTSPDPLIAQAQRLQLLEKSHSLGLLLRPIWSPLHHMPMYRGSPAGSLVVAEDQAMRVLNLPSSPQLHEGFRK